MLVYRENSLTHRTTPVSLGEAVPESEDLRIDVELKAA